MIGLLYFTLTTAPIVSFYLPSNIVVTDRGIVTVLGVNFRTSDMTPTVGLDDNSCSTAAWSSKTSVACAVITSTSYGPSKDATMTVSGVVGSRTAGFTFDGVTRIYLVSILPASLWSFF